MAERSASRPLKSRMRATGVPLPVEPVEILLAALSTAPVARYGPAVPQLRVVTLNIGSLLEAGWQERRHEVVAWLHELQPDVVCLQEAWQDSTTANSGGWVIEQLGPGWHWRFGGFPFAPSMWPDPSMHFGSVIASRWPIDDHHLYRLPVGDQPSPMVAGVPWELLHARTAGLDVYSTHLAPAPSDGLHRQRQVLAIDDLVRGSRGLLDRLVAFGERRAAMPPIVCGDFNAEPDSDEIRFLCGLTALDNRTTFFQDAWRVAGDGPGLTQDWRLAPLAAGLNVHRKRIDYVFVGDPFLRQGDGGRVLSAALAFDRPLTGVIASDHAGVVVDLLWPSRPT